MYVYVCMYVCTCVYVRVCMYVCMYVVMCYIYACIPLQKCGTCAAYIIYAICFCAALILRTCEPHSAYVQNVRHKQNIGHMRKMCAGGIHCNMCAVCAQSSRYVQNMRSLRTILKICAQYVQFAHIIKKEIKKKKFSTSCWSPVQALGKPNV